MLWLLESGVFGDVHPLLEPALRAGHNVIHADAFGSLPRVRGPVVFHGSMDVARRMHLLGFAPGIDEPLHEALTLIEKLGPASINHGAIKTTVREIVHMPYLIARAVGTENVFVRPVSPFKQFSGRTMELDAGVMVDDFDLGYYYDDVDLPIIVAPRREIKREFRCVMKGSYPVSCAEYDPRTRSPVPARPKETGDVEAFNCMSLACSVSKDLGMRDPIYILDVGLTDEGPKIIESNPFSFSDLYGSDLDEVIYHVAGCQLSR